MFFFFVLCQPFQHSAYPKRICTNLWRIDRSNLLGSFVAFQKLSVFLFGKHRIRTRSKKRPHITQLLSPVLILIFSRYPFGPQYPVVEDLLWFYKCIWLYCSSSLYVFLGSKLLWAVFLNTAKIDFAFIYEAHDLSSLTHQLFPFIAIFNFRIPSPNQSWLYVGIR